MCDKTANKKESKFRSAFNDSIPFRGDVDSWATRLGVTAVLTALTNSASPFFNVQTLPLIYACLFLFAVLSILPLFDFHRTWWSSMKKHNGSLGNLPVFLFILTAFCATVVLVIPTIGVYITTQIFALGLLTIGFGVIFVTVGSLIFALISDFVNHKVRKYFDAKKS